jgi:hypothetical protein
MNSRAWREILSVMDGTLWQTLGWVVLWWLAIAVLVAAGLSLFFRGATLRERALAAQPARPRARPRRRVRRPAA